MGLTVNQELSVWRKQATISVQEEFAGKPLPPGLEDSLPPDLQALFDRVRTGVKRSAEQYINLCNFVERLAKRNEGYAAESARIASSLTNLTDVSSDTYAADPGDILPLNMGLKAVAMHLNSSQTLLEDEARGWDEGVLEDLKKQRDILVSVRDMFDRRDRFDRDNIPQLERRIKNNEEKLLGIRAKPEGLVKPGEAERVEEAIFKASSFRAMLPCSLTILTEPTGQAINRRSACTRSLCQGMHPRRDHVLPVLAVPGVSSSSGLGGRASQVRRTPSRQLSRIGR
jgi:sorting nexin-8